MVATCGGNPHALTAPTTNVVIMDTAHIRARIIRTDGTTSINRDVVVISPWDKGLVMIGGTTMSPACVIMRSLDIINKHGFTGSVEIGDTQKIDTSIDGNLGEEGDSMSIFRKVIGQKLSHSCRSNI